MIRHLKYSFLILILIWFILAISACRRTDEVLFKLVPSNESGVTFNNLITDNDSFNILTYEYIYNGGGVALADFNNDQQVDIFFTGNMVSNKLYLNKGKLHFEDISQKAGIEAVDFWCSGVAIADVNYDGLEDIYISTNTHSDSDLRRNLLYVNQGLDEDGIPHFQEMAKAYGLADTSYTMNAVFFDYDNDLDLDMFMIVNEMHDLRNPVKYREKRAEKNRIRVDRLYRNTWNDSLGHPFFEDVSQISGIVVDGYSLGVNVADINDDGWRDIYVSNDFISNDVLYLNNRDGTFRNVARDYFKHTSHSAMGNDIVDINNDGRADVITLDMLPEDNYRRKTMMGPSNYMSYINNRKYGYDFQFVRNTLQLNQGKDPAQGQLIFSDISLLAGISATDWSWTPMVADFDHDGYRDLIITNGFPKDITDRDFTDYQADVYKYASKKLLLSKIPEVKLKNYAFKNTGNLKFEQVTEQWGIDRPSFSNGAAYADLDNDGDLDYVVNNINDPAFIYENLLLNNQNNQEHYLRLNLVGTKENPHAMGTKLRLYLGSDLMTYEQNIYRGYLSSIESIVHFGLGKHATVDSLEIIWPDETQSKLFDLAADQLIEIKFSEISKATMHFDIAGDSMVGLYSSSTSMMQYSIKHQELDYVDFNVQPLLAHKFSQFGPGLSVGDVNSDGLSDIIMGGSAFKPSLLLMQTESGVFQIDSLETSDQEKRHESLGTLFFDADNDGDDDLYIVSGGYEFAADDSYYEDRFYRNEKGHLILDTTVIPLFHQSGTCVRAADYDRDGDLDLVIAGRVYPHQFPRPCSSILLENKLELGSLKFAIANDATAPELNDLGNVSDIIWSDFNQDGWVDLVIAGEWMPITMLENVEGSFSNVTQTGGLTKQIGWWTCIIPGDIDLDGDVDYIVGNFGDNTLFTVSNQNPVSIYANDFDDNGGYDAIITSYFPGLDGKMQEYPWHGRSDFAKQINKVKDRFTTHDLFARAGINDILDLQQREGTTILRANQLKSVFIENMGKGVFDIHDLPVEAQLAPIYSGIVRTDDEKGGATVLLVGNDFGMDLLTGRCDAFNGLVLQYRDAEFRPLSISESGFLVSGDAKSLVMVEVQNKTVWVVGQNGGDLLTFKETGNQDYRKINLNQHVAYITYEVNQEKRRVEAYYGSGFLSQSQRQILLPREADNIMIVDFSGLEQPFVEREPSL